MFPSRLKVAYTPASSNGYTQELPSAAEKSRFIGVLSPSFFTHWDMGSMPTAMKVFTAGMFIEFTSAVRKSTSPTYPSL